VIWFVFSDFVVDVQKTDISAFDGVANQILAINPLLGE